MFVIRRHNENPLLSPKREHPWQAFATYNPSIVKKGLRTRMYYRALANPAAIVAPFAPQSTIGMAESHDGVHFKSERQVLTPREPWEAFGCEDPRATVIDGVTYLTYTALGGFPFGPDNIKAAIAMSHDGEHFDERHLVTPFNAKAFALFPEKINGEYVAFVTAHTDYTPEHPRPTIGIAKATEMSEFWNEDFWNAWHNDLESHALPNLRRSDEDHIEIGAPPIKTDKGWLLIYSYIQHYYDESKRTFCVEAALLDLKNPENILARSYPFMVPEEVYERFGIVPNIVFPTSAHIEGEMLQIYYGAADTTCAVAEVRLDDLLDSLTQKGVQVTRAEENPIITPKEENAFESRATFNTAAFVDEGSVHLLYRAMDKDNTSTVGYARLGDGINVSERLPVPIYGPRESFELKQGDPHGNSGCEDPRTVVIDGRIYMTYTAYDGVHPPRGALTSLSLEDFRARNFDKWTPPMIVTPENFDDKDLALLPEKLQDGYLLYHRVSRRICADILKDLDEGAHASRCIEIMGPREGMWDAEKVGIAGPPLKVPGGYLMLYHGVSHRSRYRVGAALLDETGITVIARSADPLFEPKEQYELEGEVNNVVFPCGAVILKDTLYIYYGGADKVIGVATVPLQKLLASLS